MLFMRHCDDDGHQGHVINKSIIFVTPFNNIISNLQFTLLWYSVHFLSNYLKEICVRVPEEDLLQSLIQSPIKTSKYYLVMNVSLGSSLGVRV